MKSFCLIWRWADKRNQMGSDKLTLVFSTVNLLSNESVSEKRELMKQLEVFQLPDDEMSLSKVYLDYLEDRIRIINSHLFQE